MEELFMTEERYEKIKGELDKLKSVDRVEVAKEIGNAKAFGDLSENSEYDAAKNKEAELESKIYQLEYILKNAKIVDKAKIGTKIVSVGSTVTLYDEEFDENVTYKIMSSAEVDPSNGIFSNTSPIGKALIGKKVNETVIVEAPSGNIVYKILKISI